MKILSVVFSLEKGGTQRAAQNFAEAYSKDGHDSRLVYTKETGPREYELNEKGIQVYSISHKSFGNVLVDWKPDVVHLHSHMLVETEVRLLRKMCPDAAFIETNVFSRPSSWHDCLDSSFQLSEWCNWLYQKRSRGKLPSTVVPYPVKTDSIFRASPEAISDFRNGLKLNNDAILLGRVGQDYNGKWSVHLIDSFGRLKSRDKRYHLLLVNPAPKILDAIEKSIFKDSIHVIGRIDGDRQLSVIYSSLDIFVLIAKQGESFGMVLAESLLCQTPVITLSSPWADNSQGEVIGHNVGGIVANTPHDLRLAIEKLAHDQSLREKMGIEGRLRIIDQYDYLKVARQALAAIEESKSIVARVNVGALYTNSMGGNGSLVPFLLRIYKWRFICRYVNGYTPLGELPFEALGYLRAKYRLLMNKLSS